MTDETTTERSHTPPKKSGPTPEQIAALSADEKAQLIAELEAAIVELRRPVPEPYPKWVEIDGEPMVVQSPEEEAQKTKASAEFKAAAEPAPSPSRRR